IYIERPGSPSATTVAPTSKRRSTSIEIRRSRLASESPPKKGVATKNAFRSGELTAIGYSRSRDSHFRNLTAPHRLPGHPRRFYESDVARMRRNAPQCGAAAYALTRFRLRAHALPPTRSCASAYALMRFGGLKPVRSLRSKRRRVGGLKPVP